MRGRGKGSLRTRRPGKLVGSPHTKGWINPNDWGREEARDDSDAWPGLILGAQVGKGSDEGPGA